MIRSPSADPRIAQWTPLARALAAQFHKKLYRHHGLDDLVAMGVEALWRSTQSFDATHEAGAQFKTYAYHAIVNAFTAEMKHWRAKKRHGVTESMHEEVYGSGGTRQYACGTPSAERQLIGEEERQRVQAAVAHLRDAERFVLEKRVHEELTLKETGALKGVSRERIRQLEIRALGKLRKNLKGEYWSRAKYGMTGTVAQAR